MIQEHIKEKSGALVDRLALRVMARIFLGRHRPELSEESLRRAFQAKDLYTAPELTAHPERFFGAPETTSPIRLRPMTSIDRGQKVALSGPSGFLPFDPDMREQWASFRANQTVRAIWWRHFGRRPPAVICLHGWGGGWAWVEERAFGFRNLYRDGLDVLLMTLPFHALRADPPRIRAPVFPSTKVSITVEGAAQAVWDARNLIRYLLNQGGCPSVAVVGWSLGGLIAALLAALEPGLSSVAVISPAVSLAHVLWEHGEGHPERKRVEAAGYTEADLKATWAVVSPLSYPVRLAPDRLLIIAGRGDRICLPERARGLSQHWNNARIRWYPGGHLIQFDRSGVLSELSSFLQDTLLR